MKVLVTGATGFIGGTVARHLLKRGYHVRALVRPRPDAGESVPAGVRVVEGDLLDPQSLPSAVSGVEGVFHVAANYTFWARTRDEIYRPNVEGTRHLIEAAKAESVRRFIFTSSVGTLRAPAEGSVADETSIATVDELPDEYHQSKLLAEQMALEANGSGMEVIAVLPTTPIGEGDGRPTPTGRIILAYFRGVVAAYVDGKLNVVDVDDVSAGHVAAFERGQPGHRYLLGGENTSIRDLFGLLAQVTGVRRRTIGIPYGVAVFGAYLDHVLEGKVLRRPPYIPLYGLRALRQPLHVTSASAERELGYSPRPVRNALVKSVRWFVNHGYIRPAHLSAQHSAGGAS